VFDQEFVGVVQRQDVWVVQRGDKFDFLAEPRGTDRERHLPAQEFEGDGPMILEIFGPKDCRHTTPSELTPDVEPAGYSGPEGLKLLVLQRVSVGRGWPIMPPISSGRKRMAEPRLRCRSATLYPPSKNGSAFAEPFFFSPHFVGGGGLALRA
jgi:hypothetical protein